MPLFKKRTSAKDLGRIIYVVIKEGFFSKTPLSYYAFLDQLGTKPRDLPKYHMVEIFVGLLFAALIAIQKKYSDPLAGRIMDSALEEFLKQSREFGIDKLQLKPLIGARFMQYSENIENQTGAGPAFHVGKQYYWNIIGRKKEDAIAVMVASKYIFGKIVGVEAVLKMFQVSDE